MALLENVIVITEFIDKATVWILAFIYNADGNLDDPTAVKITLLDSEGVVKTGYLSVAKSADFSDGLVVTGATSGATGLVISKPANGKTLELQQITGVWQSGEVITDTADGGSGSTTTTSTIASASMTQYESETGIYEYYYHKGTTAVAMDKGEWRGRVDAIDGELTNAVFSPQGFSFRVK